MELLELMKNRRSIRKFQEEPLTKEQVEKLVKAGALAPSSKNKRPVKLIVIQDREKIKELKSCKNAGTAGLATAPCAVVILGDTLKSDVWQEDASIAAIMMQLEAESLGLGSVWIQIRNRQSDTGDSEKAVREVLDIPEFYGVLAILAIGNKAEEKEPYKEESLDLSGIHFEHI
ncbi:nitroreductase family protein [Clostridium sp. HBUAS56010]|uniref:nitroreductase family protein n=1 Tax=Clostridium sp. HBUAS56010 TaxID=2571127 RepID=UPI0011781F28|nr:nitroreductase family protein [Clostridium sp. HBUAS56010]